MGIAANAEEALNAITEAPGAVPEKEISSEDVTKDLSFDPAKIPPPNPCNCGSIGGDDPA